MARINLYRFKYSEEIDPSGTEYVGVMAQEVVAAGRGDCVHRGEDGYLLVNYQRLGAPFMKLSDWERLGGSRTWNKIPGRMKISGG
jgi:hypothetical protein